MSKLLVLVDGSGSTIEIRTQISTILSGLSEHGEFDVLVFDDLPRLFLHVYQNDSGAIDAINASLQKQDGGGSLPQIALDAYVGDWDYRIILTDGKLLPATTLIDTYVLLGQDTFVPPGVTHSYSPAPGAERKVADLLWSDFTAPILFA
jgi:hypothetical protein